MREILLSQRQEKLYNALIKDNIVEFKERYINEVFINDKNILLIAVESGAINIVSYLIQSEKKLFKKLTRTEKENLFDYIINLYPQEKWKEEIIHYIINHYAISIPTLHILLLNILKYGSLSITKKIMKKNVFLTKKNILNLLDWSKGAILNENQKENLIYYFSHLIKNNHKKIFRLLSLSVGSNTEGYCLEIEIYNNLTHDKKKQWHNYLMHSNNMLYHIHQTYLRAKKKDGFNIMDWNYDFLFFLTYHILIDIAQNIENKEDIKINHNILKKIHSIISGNMILLGNIGLDLIKHIQSIILINKLQNKLNNKIITIEEIRNKKI